MAGSVELVTTYNHAADAIVSYTRMPRALLHVHFGLLIYCVSQLLLGTRRGSLVAVFVTIMLAVFHELMNRFFHGSWRVADTSKDLVLTLFWPTLHYAVSSYRRWIWARQEQLGAIRRPLRRVKAALAHG